VTIKVSDEGGGIPRSGLASIWTYLYSTAKSQVQMETLQVRPRKGASCSQHRSADNGCPMGAVTANEKHAMTAA
jgi:hypothetical protein